MSTSFTAIISMIINKGLSITEGRRRQVTHIVHEFNGEILKIALVVFPVKFSLQICMDECYHLSATITSDSFFLCSGRARPNFGSGFRETKARYKDIKFSPPGLLSALSDSS